MRAASQSNFKQVRTRVGLLLSGLEEEGTSKPAYMQNTPTLRCIWHHNNNNNNNTPRNAVIYTKPLALCVCVFFFFSPKRG